MRKAALLFLFLAFFLTTGRALAQTSPGFTVSPAILKLDLDSDSPVADISYTNKTPNDAVVSFKAEDFTSLDDGWQVKFLQPKDAQNYQFSLSSWLQFDQDQMVVKAGETQSVKVSINKAELPSGTHYGAVIGFIKAPSRNSNVSVVEALTTLLFVHSANGNDIEDGNIDSLQPLRSFLEFPSRFVLRFRNGGNVDLTPHGLVSVYDPFSNQISKAVLNSESLITLPESIRRYDLTTVNLTEGRFLWPGRYTVVISSHFGKDDRTLSTTEYFWSVGSINFTELVLALIILAGLVLIIRKIRAVPRR